jgi:SAM-dependent methyltransferase
MVTQQTSAPGNFTRLMADFKRRHPWVSLQNQYEARSVPVPSSRLPDPTKLSRLDHLLPILRCPVSGLKLTYSDDRLMLISVDGLQTWPIAEGRPVLSPGMAVPTIMDEQHISNDLPDIALDLIRNTKGPVLNLSAGGSRTKFDHVVEVEYAVFRHTDLVADAHTLPFDDAVFEAVIVMNAFEHYHTPDKVAAELFRILKPGGRILVRTAFLQPLHERPWHFYNCTRYGIAKWFGNFDTEHISVSDNFCPNHSVAWLLSETEAALRAEVSTQSADAFLQAPIGRMVEIWRDPSKRETTLWTDFTKISQASQDITAAGFELVGRKPNTLPDLTGTRSFVPGA